MATPELESLVAAKRVLAPNYALHVAIEEHADAVSKLGKASLREAVAFFLRHHRVDVPRLPLAEVSELFAQSREQSGLSPQYISHCRQYTRKLTEAFPGLCLSDLTTAALDKWMGNLKLGATTKNDVRRVPGTLGNWAENQGHLIKGGNPFLGMVRYKEAKATVSMFTSEQIASLLKKADATLRPFIALGAFAGLRTAELQRLDWSEIDLDRGFVTVAASKAKTQRRRLVPISDNLKAWLTPIRQASGPVCVHVSAQQAAKAKCKGFGWAKNGLRHSFISYRLAMLHDTARVALEAAVIPLRLSSGITGNWLRRKPRRRGLTYYPHKIPWRRHLAGGKSPICPPASRLRFVLHCFAGIWHWIRP